MMNEKLYKASDLIGILLEELPDDVYLNVVKRLAVTPTAVVHCNGCKHYQPFKGERAKVNTDKSGWCGINDDSVRADDYCSYGERRSE